MQVFNIDHKEYSGGYETLSGACAYVSSHRDKGYSGGHMGFSSMQRQS
jgi:hypothetical protein